jgi:hypothetical protein
MPIPLVSIVINNFNYGRFLQQSIDSALAQTYSRREVVVVDDCSTDGSREIMEACRDRIVPVLRATNGGQGAAINDGFRVTKGEIVIFLDADDYLHPEAAERVAARWISGSSKLQYRLDIVDASGRKIALHPPPDVHFDSGDVTPRLLATGRYQCPVMSGNAWSGAVLRKILPVPEEDFRLCADGYLVTVAPFHGPVISLEESLGAYRLHGANAWSVVSATVDPVSLAGHLRRALRHDAARYRALEGVARGLGIAVAAAPGLRDPEHLSTRLTSLCLEPEHHPHPGDRRARLGLRGLISTLRASLPLRQRVLLALSFIGGGFLPRPAAARAATWVVAPASRPPAVEQLFRIARRVLGRGASGDAGPRRPSRQAEGV